MMLMHLSIYLGKKGVTNIIIILCKWDHMAEKTSAGMEGAAQTGSDTAWPMSEAQKLKNKSQSTQEQLQVKMVELPSTVWI